MRFMILRRADASTEAGVLPSADLLNAMARYHKELVQAGVLRAGEGLHPSARGARITFSGAQASVTDGPFSAAKELVAGFSIIDVKSKQEAIEWVKRWPLIDGSGEVELEIRETGCSGGVAGFEESEAAAGASPNPQPEGIRFMVLLKADKNYEADVIPDQQRLVAMGKYNQEGAKAGVILAGEGLQPSAKGARVKFTGGKPTVIDGPFTEVKELIAGFWLIRVKSKQAAIEWARHYPYPLGPEAEVEIRQVLEAQDCGDALRPELREAHR
jgi:hypothetical protein